MPLADGVKLGSVYLPPTTRQVITISSPSCFGPNCVPFSWRPQRSSMSGCSGSTKIAKQKKKEAVSEGGRERESTAGGTLWVLTARTPAQAGRQPGGTSLFSILTYYRQIETEALRLGCAKVHTTTVNALIMTFDILQNSSTIIV